MTRTRTAFFCTECGNETPRWQGQCPVCDAWNTLVQEPVARRARPRESSATRPRTAASPVRIAEIPGETGARRTTGLPEFDFVLGGGIVAGSVVLVGGEPGIGKSTLLLQCAARLEASGFRALYVSGEESAAQVRLRADRLEEAAGAVTLLAETALERVLAVATDLEPSVVFVDSIQTIHAEEIDGAPGNVNQVRECAAQLQRFAKETGTAVFLVGHVTKGGIVAGPRTLEHMVDTVLYFEIAALDHRVLRATKNRFGSVDEIGVFRMGPRGLVTVENPSNVFIEPRGGSASGSAVTALIEGTRPLLIEVQGLCTRASYGAPQRVATGFDRQRLALLLAVLEKRAGIPFGTIDVFLNVAGGMRVTEPGGDLAVAAALASSVHDRALPGNAVFIGEMGLGGELRPVRQLERRLSEAARLGFEEAWVPAREEVHRDARLRIQRADRVADVFARLFP